MDSIKNKEVYDNYSRQTGSVEKKATATLKFLEDQCEKNHVCWVHSEKEFNRVRKVKDLVRKPQKLRFSSPDVIALWEEVFVKLVPVP